ncbi:MAG: hypothetical protein MI866_20965 [Bacteroidales bacterium]|nr:hypothetical protein [Bacteroidales bacterium]
MKTILFLLLSLYFPLNTIAQANIYCLHNSVGDTICFNERERYVLFTDIEMDSADFLLIKFNNESYYLEVHRKNKIIDAVDLTEETIHKSKNRIDRLNQFFAIKNKPDTLLLTNVLNVKSDSLSLNLKLDSDDFRKQIRIDEAINFHRRMAQEMEENIKKGHVY